MTISELKDYLNNFNDDLEIHSINKYSYSNNIYIEFKSNIEKNKED